MKLAIIIGTRPEIIKMSPIIRCCVRNKIPHLILHTGQHYSFAMDRIFFKELELEPPQYNLKSGEKTSSNQLKIMINNIKDILIQEKPDIAIVQGDTNSVLAGAVAAKNLGILVGHHEAGLRSHDLNMIEESNRIITDHLSDYLFAPTKEAVKNLELEKINKLIILSGNTIVDAVLENVKFAKKNSNIMTQLKLKKKNYFLLTCHRAENVDSKDRLEAILKGVEKAGRKYRHYKTIFPIHPRTETRIQQFSLKVPENITIIKPLGFLEFLQLEEGAKIIFTDSGGLQEEACILKTPCITVRDNTERPETLKDGMNILTGADPDKIETAVEDHMKRTTVNWINPFGDGKASERIISTLTNQKKLPV